MKLKKHTFVKFLGINNEEIFAFICKINADNVDYVRSSLTRWSVSTVLIEKSITITREEFVNKVIENANNSGVLITKRKILSCLSLFKKNFDCDNNELYEIIEKRN